MQQTRYSADASCKQKRAHLADDRLSALPDVLLHAIMSFLKARQVVQTCVLSTRWRHLWCSVPCLDLDLEEFDDGDMEKSLDYCERQQQVWPNFEDFTDNLLYHKNIDIALLDTFRMCCPSRYYVRDNSDRWIRRGIKHSPCWRVKTLHLSGISLVHHFARHISSGCPFLEDLELKDYIGTLDDITSFSLKKLVIVGSYNLFCNPWTITTPALASLCLSGIDCFGVLNMTSLVNASIHLSTYFEDDDDDDNASLVNQVEFLYGLSNVSSLELSDFRSIVVGDRSLKFPSFKNLRTLCLRNCDLSDDFRTLELILENSLNLERLTLRHCKFSKDSNRGEREAPKSKKTSSLDVRCENLKLTEILYEDDDVRLLVEFLFDISENLPNNTMKITKIEDPQI